MSTPNKTTRACDYCRKKKARCNGAEMSGSRCLTCVRYSVECTYDIPPKARPTKAYVKYLENRLASLESTIRVYSMRGNPSSSTDANRRTDDSESEGDDGDDDQPKLAPLPPRAYSKRPHGDPLSFPEEIAGGGEDSSTETGMHSAQSVVVQESLTSRFHGESSLFVLTNALSDKWKFTSIHDLRSYRREFWETPEWMLPLAPPPPPLFEFPEMDLMLHLVDCYFENLNVTLPILHRPSFVRSIEGGLHKVDGHFGAVVLIVCAIGCRCTTDPRIMQEVTTSSSSTAWKLFNQITINRSRKLHFITTSVYEAQLYPLAALFFEGYCPPSTAWLVIGYGLRVVQDNGVHRKTFSAKTILERELWKRTFWVLIVLDRCFSALLGRACGLRDEDFDAELPLQCDDEDLQESDLSPPPVARLPTQTCSFLAIIRLNRILAFILRTIYSTKRSRAILGYVGKHWEQHIVMALDSALNKWVDCVPEHLHWGSEASKKHRMFLIQSASTWCQFYETQLHVHRAIALGNSTDPERAAASMIICKNAAKRCIEIVESANDVLTAPLCSYLLTKSIFASSVFLILMFWKKGGFDRDSPEYRAIEASKVLIGRTSKRWRVSARLLDILDVLQGVSDSVPISPGFRVEDWYRPHLGKFLCVDKDGVLCHAEYSTLRPRSNGGGQCVGSSIPGQSPEMECDAGSGSKPSVAPMESLVYDDLMREIEEAGRLWPNPAQTPDSGQPAGRTPDTTDGNWNFTFYESFLNQISDLAGRSPT